MVKIAWRIIGWQAGAVPVNIIKYYDTVFYIKYNIIATLC